MTRKGQSQGLWVEGDLYVFIYLLAVYYSDYYISVRECGQAEFFTDPVIIILSLCCKYLKNISIDWLHFWLKPTLWPSDKTIQFGKISPRAKGGCSGVSKFGPNDTMAENVSSAYNKKVWQIDMWLLLDTNRKSYVLSPTALLGLTLSGIEKSHSRLLLDTNRKSYCWVQLHY